MEPCPKCDAPYGYRNIMGLSTDTYRFSVSCHMPKNNSKKTKKKEEDPLHLTNSNPKSCSDFFDISFDLTLN